jgi:sec-independent protein translocase protein TatA
MTGWTSPTHLVLLLLIALLLFGAKRLPEIGKSLGHGMREFKDSVSETGRQLTEPTTTAELSSADEHERTTV